MAKVAPTSSPAVSDPVIIESAVPSAPVKEPRKTRRSPKKRFANRPAAKSVSAPKRATNKPVVQKRKKRRPAEPVNKAQAIRDVVKKLGRKVRPRDVIAALAAKGITVSSPQVSMTLKSAGYHRARSNRKKTATTAVSNGMHGGEFAVADLVIAKQFADRLGGTDQLKNALVALERLL